MTIKLLYFLFFGAVAVSGFAPVEITSKIDNCVASGSQLNLSWKTEQIDHVALYLSQQQIQPKYGAWFAHPVYGTSYVWTVPTFKDWRVEPAKQIYIEGHLADHTALGGDWSNYFKIRDKVCDFIPPKSPTNLKIVERTPSTVTLTWDATEDNQGGSGLLRYNIWIVVPGQQAMGMGEVKAEVNTATIYLEKVEAYRNLSLYVTAADNQANTSEPSNIIVLKSAPAPAKTPPEILQGGVKTETVTPTTPVGNNKQEVPLKLGWVLRIFEFVGRIFGMLRLR